MPGDAPFLGIYCGGRERPGAKVAELQFSTTFSPSFAHVVTGTPGRTQAPT
ncbi:hypothetical protein ACQPZP_26080 [Spirillospora sp. CA-142024]|uniref:hypothetical protein n=1 Tax=Spirillospora sp. CA-142024 TaxID=3240036 RepID=UPI003D931EB3